MSLFADLIAASAIPPETPSPEVDPTSKRMDCVASLESIAHLQKKIELMWGTQELDVFVGRLIMDSREGARQGLPVEVAAELLFLAAVNKVVRAIDASKRLNLSLREAYRLIDSGDQSRFEADRFDNPLVSRDTVTKQSSHEVKWAPKKHGEESRDGVVARLWRALLDHGRIMAYFVVGALFLILVWPTISGFLAGSAK